MKKQREIKELLATAMERGESSEAKGAELSIAAQGLNEGSKLLKEVGLKDILSEEELGSYKAYCLLYIMMGALIAGGAMLGSVESTGHFDTNLGFNIGERIVETMMTVGGALLGGAAGYGVVNRIAHFLYKDELAKEREKRQQTGTGK